MSWVAENGKDTLLQLVPLTKIYCHFSFTATASCLCPSKLPHVTITAKASTASKEKQKDKRETGSKKTDRQTRHY